MFVFLFLFFSLTIAADTYAKDDYFGYFVIYIVDKCYVTGITEAAKKYKKVSKDSASKFQLYYAATCSDKASDWIIDTESHIVYSGASSCTDDTLALPVYYYDTLSCFQQGSQFPIVNFDGKNVYFSYYTDTTCKTLSTDTSVYAPVDTCVDSGKTDKVQYTAANLYKRDVGDDFEIYVEGRCYVDSIATDSTKYVVVHSDGLMYQDANCVYAESSKVAATGDEYKVIKVLSLPEYYYADRNYAKIDCNDPLKLDYYIMADYYHTSLATCNEKNSLNFTTTKKSITFNYYDSKCETPDSVEPKSEQKYAVCTKNKDSNNVFYFYGKNSAVVIPDKDNSIEVIISIVAIILMALF
ncbi:hypothetical protein EIN_116010 [Entamoeba invadens IP1]|uniref:Uncharacterized protein n=1 Tax=Entamoeba invadens IP1 TaxID=370355 RepID=L7FPC0_ENTIV|nr:hypothetical protein EIN_116010 [Entamoeba invadens IP1]ELP94520.1 hypothetical protein EIN_116010 [Entamoeba invadens IP1]|eukprot:XP_004261291.1 hypothetical protein EIN_116010 [Entamoeba invadens IP1]